MTTSSDLVHGGHESFDDVVQSRAPCSHTSDISQETSDDFRTSVHHGREHRSSVRESEIKMGQSAA